jgi:predicted acylesterase/phospholipase RssA
MRNINQIKTLITPRSEKRSVEALRRLTGIIGTLATCGAIVSLTGCCATRSSVNPGAAVAKYHFETNSFQRALQRRAEPAEDKVDILILSGGGSHGAWGAGVLRGWRENATYPRPKKFAVVTGVSTGALLATYAFLGEPADDALLEEAYTTARTSDIYKKKFLLFALFSDSLYNSKPLAGRVKKFISPETVDRVSEAGQEGRRLYVGTVSHDRGALVIWDLTAIAMDKANPNRVDLYRQVVLASASIPILVQPVQIDGELYADGGARAQLFFEKRFFRVFQKMKDEQKLYPNLTLHVIVNGKLGLERTNVNDCIEDIAFRTLDMLLDANEIGDLYHIEYVLRLNHYGRFALSWIPPEVEVTNSEEFDPAMMQKLFDAGRKFGKTTANWPDQIPNLDLNRH